MDIEDWVKRNLKAMHDANRERDKQLVASLNRLMAQVNFQSQLSVFQQQKEILARIYNDAAAYTNLVMLGGYAGAFAIWQLTKEHLSYSESLTVGLLLSSSILLFAGFEVCKMISQAMFFRGIQKLINTNELSKNAETWEAAWIEHSTSQARIWVIFLIPTVITGFSAGFVLIIVFLGSLGS